MKNIHNFNLQDLIIYILIRWRIVLVIVAVLAVLFGSYKTVKDYRNSSISGEPVKIETEEEKADKLYEEKRNKYEQYLEEYAGMEAAVEADQERLDELETATQTSIKMGVDPYQCPQTIVTWSFTIPMEELERTSLKFEEAMDAILNSYETKIKNSLDYSVAMKELGASEEVAREILTLTTDLGRNIQTLKVIADTKEHADIIAQDWMEQIKGMQASVSSEYCGHELKSLSYTNGVVKDLVLADEKKKNDDYLVAYRAQLAKDQATLRNMAVPTEPTLDECLREIRLEEAKLAEQDAWNDIAENVESFTLKKAIKNYVFGIVLGVIVAGGCLCVRFLGEDVLRGASELESNYGLYLLGSLPIVYKDSKHFGQVDRAVKRIVFGKAPIDKDSEKDKIVALLQSLTNNDTRLLISSYEKDADASELYNYMVSKLSGLELIYTDNLLNSADAVLSLNNVDGIVLIERRDASKLEKIAKRVNLAEKLGTTIIGVVAL